MSGVELLIPLVVVAFIAIAVFGAIAAHKRRKALAEWAAQRGLRQVSGKDRDLRRRYPGFECLKQGDGGRYAYNRMIGTVHGRGVMCFDYHYHTRSTDSKGRTRTTSHHFSGVIVTHGLPFKPLLIRPEHGFDRLSAFFGFDDIDFELDAFSRTFFVKGPDKRFAYDILHQETMEFLLHAPRFSVDCEGPAMLVFRNRRFDPGDYDAAIALAEGMLDRLPEYLLREMKGTD